jgi:hypothetical protein
MAARERSVFRSVSHATRIFRGSDYYQDSKDTALVN